MLNIASAGNSNVDLQHKFTDSTSPNDGSYPVEDRTITGACVDLPAEAPGVVTVSATGPTQLKSYYSSYGQGVVDVTAPGGDTRFRTQGVSSTITDAVLSTVQHGRRQRWGYKQGTSMAGPHAAGVAALALSAHPGLKPGALASLLERTSTALPCPDGVYNPVPLHPAGSHARAARARLLTACTTAPRPAVRVCGSSLALRRGCAGRCRCVARPRRARSRRRRRAGPASRRTPG